MRLLKFVFIFLVTCWLGACEKALDEGVPEQETALQEQKPEVLAEVNLKPLCGQPPYDLCGYVDKKAAELYLKDTFILPANFETASEFYEGLAVVSVNGKYGYIDGQGEFVIEPQFSLAGDFDQGLAIVEIDGLLGVINRSGKIVVKPQFGHATVHSSEVIIASLPKIRDNTIELNPMAKGVPSTYVPFGEGMARVAGGLNLDLPKIRRKTIETAYHQTSHSPGADYYRPIAGNRLYSIKSGWVSEDEYVFRIFNRNDRSFIWASADQTRSGLMKLDGTWHQEPRYTLVRELINGRAIYRKDNHNFTVIDENGDGVFTAQHVRSDDFRTGYVKVNQYSYRETAQRNAYTKNIKRKRQQYGLIDRDGNLMGGQYFEKVDMRGRGQKIVVDNGKASHQWFKISKDGTLTRDDTIAYCPNYLLVPTSDHKMEVRSSTGRTMLDYAFDAKWGADRLFDSRGRDIPGAQIRSCHKPSGVTSEGRVGTLLSDGSLVGGRLFDKVIWPGYVKQWVLEDGKWGLIDLDGQYHIEPFYDTIEPMQYGVVKATVGAKIYYFDKFYIRSETQPKPLPFKFTPGWRCPQTGSDLGTRVKSKNGMWGMVDSNNGVLVPFKYRALSCFRNGVAWAPNEEKRQWCPIGQDGNFLTGRVCRITYYPPKKDNYIPGTGKLLSLPERFDENPFESSVLWVASHLEASESGENKVGLWIENPGNESEKVTYPVEK